jgi:hypothetical protein
MNNYLNGQSVQTSPCDEFTHGGLNKIAELMLQLKNLQLNSMYASRGDKRTLTSDEEHTALWEDEHAKAAASPNTHGEGTINYNITRDGKCAEIVMWWVHHLTAGTQDSLVSGPDFTLPLMPTKHSETDDQVCTRRYFVAAVTTRPPSPDLVLSRSNFNPPPLIAVDFIQICNDVVYIDVDPTGLLSEVVIRGCYQRLLSEVVIRGVIRGCLSS